MCWVQPPSPLLTLFFPPPCFIFNFPDISSTSPVLREPDHGAVQHQEAEVRTLPSSRAVSSLTWGCWGASPASPPGVGGLWGGWAARVGAARVFCAPLTADLPLQPAHVHGAAALLHPLHHVRRGLPAQVSLFGRFRVGFWGGWRCWKAPSACAPCPCQLFSHNNSKTLQNCKVFGVLLLVHLLVSLELLGLGSPARCRSPRVL